MFTTVGLDCDQAFNTSVTVNNKAVSSFLPLILPKKCTLVLTHPLCRLTSLDLPSLVKKILHKMSTKSGNIFYATASLLR